MLFISRKIKKIWPLTTRALQMVLGREPQIFKQVIKIQWDKIGDEIYPGGRARSQDDFQKETVPKQILKE